MHQVTYKWYNIKRPLFLQISCDFAKCTICKKPRYKNGYKKSTTKFHSIALHCAKSKIVACVESDMYLYAQWKQKLCSSHIDVLCIDLRDCNNLCEIDILV